MKTISSGVLWQSTAIADAVNSYRFKYKTDPVKIYVCDRDVYDATEFEGIQIVPLSDLPDKHIWMEMEN